MNNWIANLDKNDGTVSSAVNSILVIQLTKMGGLLQAGVCSLGRKAKRVSLRLFPHRMEERR